MSAQDPIKILLVIGEPTFAGQIAAALTHPRFTVQAADTEQRIVAALTSQSYQLIAVGGQVGRRGPLVLCDAVRIRQPDSHVLVLVRDETEEAQLRDHMARQLQHVQYMDLRNVQVAVERAAKVRAEALRLTGADEDTESAAQWQDEVAKLALASQPASPASAGPSGPPPLHGASPAAPPPTRESAPDAAEGEINLDAEAAEPPADANVPRIMEAVTDEDYTFALRFVARTRGVDFRSPLVPTPVPEGTDRAVVRLRDRVRELERTLARVAHAFAGRSRELDAAKAQLAELGAGRQGVESDLQQLRTQLADERERAKLSAAELQAKVDTLAAHRDDLDARLRGATADLSRERDEAKTKEASFATMLKQAQDAFVQLREQSAQAIAYYERRAAEQQRSLQEATDECARLRTANQQATDQLTQLTRAVEERAALAGNLTAASDGLAQERASLEQLRQRHSELSAEAAGLRGTLAAAEAQVREQATKLQELEERHSRDKEAAVAALREELERQRVRAEEHAQMLLENERRLASLKGELEDAQKKAAAAVEAERVARGEAESRAQAVTEREQRLVVLDVRTQELQRELDKVVAAEAAARAEAEARQTTLTEREQKVAVLQAQLEEKGRETAKLLDETRLLHEELERSRTRALDQAFDARLRALEEVVRLTADGLGRQADILAALEHDANLQTPLLNRLERLVESAPMAAAAPSEPVAAREPRERRESRESTAPDGEKVPDGSASSRQGDTTAIVGDRDPYRRGASASLSVSDRLRRLTGGRDWLVPAAALGLVVIIALVVTLIWSLASRDDMAPAPTVAVADARGAAASAGRAKEDPPKKGKAPSAPTTPKEPEAPKAAQPEPAKASAASASPAPTATASAAATPTPATPSPTPTAAAAPAAAATPAATAGAAASAAAPAPAAASASSKPAVAAVTDPEQRKTLRRQLFDAYKAKKYDEAADSGTKLRAGGGAIDWEALLTLGHSLRKANRNAEAAEVYRAFAKQYPDNKYTREAEDYASKLR